MKPNTKKTKKIFLILTAVLVSLGIGWYVYAATVADTFDSYNDTNVYREYLLIKGGALKLGGPTYTGITEDTCNALAGWHWYVTNSRPACWSKALAVRVSWNRKGVAHDTDNPGAYTCAVAVTSLTERMEAASKGEWYKIVSSVNDVSITSADNGSAGYSKISALAISDCLDRVRDLCTGNGCLGANLTVVNSSLAVWASATGDKSALPYYDAQNDYTAACGQNSSNDLPLGCDDGLFHKNKPACGTYGENCSTWASAAYSTTYARVLGNNGCSETSGRPSSDATNEVVFRVVVRP